MEITLTINASDPLAPFVAMEYARECEDAGYSKEYIEKIFDIAYAIRKWQSENRDKVIPPLKYNYESAKL